MNLTSKFLFLVFLAFGLTSCVSKKKFATMQDGYVKDLKLANEQLGKCGEGLNDYMNRLATCNDNLKTIESTLGHRQEQIDDLKEQLEDAKRQRDKQYEQVGDLTVLTQSANDNIKETLQQLEQKEKYIHLLQAAKSKSDSINLALAVNLKSVLREGIEDSDVDIKVDKTVVFINLSDKMLYQSGSSILTPKANEVLGKIAKIIESKPDLEVMVEGYTDNVPIKTSCYQDNWDLSVKRATSVVRVLQKNYNVDPNRLIAAGRGEYNTLASNDTSEGRSINRRTRIIIMPKLNQFYDLLNPNMATK
jgi:chemotaxis protein MotB